MSRILILALACLLPRLVLAETVVPLSIGGTEVRLAIDDGYVRASEKAPAAHATASAALPPPLRLVEAFISEDDLKRMVTGQPLQQTYLQVQSLRDAEGVTFSENEWQELLPTIAEQLGALDMNAIATSSEAGANKRMSESAGARIDVNFGDIGKPVLYGDRARSLRFTVLMPITVQVAGTSKQLLLEAAGAVTLLRGKMLYVYAYRPHQPGDDTTRVRAALDRFVDRAETLNAEPAK
ncbi:hypothetical protein [Lysobacter sp. CFH 32150]|uniref:hypothetical protein n=1 Tax=Lysobacter sp. CFH 32150 TaxID=2927128 RepID=UPI001FA7414D|nr:hypothetical protein [Lysobacter sp. CFH 32150]MCI4567536.1 hypothetical protein [Lysobacter sp. CFH 32150]